MLYKCHWIVLYTVHVTLIFFRGHFFRTRCLCVHLCVCRCSAESAVWGQQLSCWSTCLQAAFWCRARRLTSHLLRW